MEIEKNAYLITYVTAAGGNNWSGGKSVYENAVCPSCGRHMFVYLSLACTDSPLAERLNLPAGSRFEIVFCPRCEMSWDDFRYRIHPNGLSIEIVEFTQGDTLAQLPFPLFAETLPKKTVKLKSLPTDVQQLYLDRRAGRDLTEEELLHVAKTTGDMESAGPEFYPMLRAQCQLFGFPFLKQRLHIPRSVLGASMEFLACFANKRSHPSPILPDEVQLVVWYEPTTRELMLQTVI